MNYKNVSDALRKIAQNTLAQNDLAEHVIIKKGDTFFVFNQFKLKAIDDIWVVDGIKIDMHKEFNLSKSALAWCIAYIAGRLELAKQLQHLDHILVYKQADIDFLLYRLKSTGLEEGVREILQHRLSEDINARQTYKKQLTKCIKLAKLIKIR